MTWEVSLANADHLLALRKERCDGHKIWDDNNDSKLKDLITDLDSSDWRIILCTKNTGAWLNVQGNTVTGTVLVATEFREF